MNQVKMWLKKILPHSVLKPLLAQWHRSRAKLAKTIYRNPASNMKVIAITGTNGKTSTGAYIGEILKESGYKYGVSTTAFFDVNGEVTANDTNMTVTSPFKVQRLLAKMRRKKVEWVVLEVTSHAIEQNRILGIPIKAAVLTNLTQDHLDYHGTMDNYAAAKFKLFANKPEVIALNIDDEWYNYFNEAEASLHKLSYGTNPKADVRITNAKLSGSGTSFELNIDKSQTYKLSTQLPGKFNVYNAAAAAAVTYGLQMKRSNIIKGIANLHAVPGRMEIIDEGQNYAVIVDYAHTPDALENVLETVKALTKQRVIIVFGATGDRDKDKREIMGEISAKLADRMILTDEEPYSEDPAKIREDVMKGIVKQKATARTNEVADRRDAIAKAFSIAKKDDTVIITGMGHQTFMKLAGGKIPWDDREVAREELKKRSKR